MHQVRPSIRLKMRLCKHVYCSLIKKKKKNWSRIIAAAIRGDTESALSVGRDEIPNVVLRACAAKYTRQAILIRGVHAET